MTLRQRRAFHPPAKHCPVCGNDEKHGFNTGEEVDIGVGYSKVSGDWCQTCGCYEEHDFSVAKMIFLRACWELQIDV